MLIPDREITGAVHTTVLNKIAEADANIHRSYCSNCTCFVHNLTFRIKHNSLHQRALESLSEASESRPLEVSSTNYKT